MSDTKIKLTGETINNKSVSAYKSAPFFKSLVTLRFGDISIVQRIFASFIITILVFAVGGLFVLSQANELLEIVKANNNQINNHFAESTTKIKFAGYQFKLKKTK